MLSFGMYEAAKFLAYLNEMRGKRHTFKQPVEMVIVEFTGGYPNVYFDTRTKNLEISMGTGMLNDRQPAFEKMYQMLFEHDAVIVE